jgi:hypothetical protein
VDLRIAALRPYQQRVDPLADAATDGLGPTRPQHLLQAVEARADQGHAGARRFLDQTRMLPDWACSTQLERGRRIVVELGTELALVLITGALLEGYASPSLATPLLRTGRLKSDAARRLYETGQMVHNARAPGGLAPDGIGRRTVLQVRLLHSTVRRALESRGYVGPDGGRAIHQLDMAHTATAFSHKGPTRLDRLGVRLTRDELADVQHFWRVVNHLHGVDPALLPGTPEQTAALADFLDDWRFTDFPPGGELARAALRSLAGQPPFFLPEAALTTLTVRFLDDARSAAWQLHPDPRWARLLDLGAWAERRATGAWRGSPALRAVRARLNVALYGRTLRDALGADAANRAFGPIAGEEARWGPGLEAPAALRALAS